MVRNQRLILAFVFLLTEAGAQSPSVSPNASPTQELARDLMQWLPSPAQGGRSQRQLDRLLAKVPRGAPIAGEVPYFAPNPTLRARPGGLFNPGASGPGVVSTSDREPFLGGTFDPRSGWPLAILDHFKPDPKRLGPFWIASSYYCPQEMVPGSGEKLRLRQFGPKGQLVTRTPADLAKAARGRPVFVQVHGNLTYADTALGAGLWSHTWLEVNQGLPTDALFVIFDWPSWRVKRSDALDVNEKARRSNVAALHLAEFLQGLPPGGQVCLFGHSFGGRVALSALHLLAGGALDAQDGTAPVRLGGGRPDLRMRCVALASAVDRDWLVPGERLDRALWRCEGVLNLFNPHDEALLCYPLMLRSGHRAALGRAGMTDAQRERLGGLGRRYAQRDVSAQLGPDHTLLDATSDKEIARWIAPYTGFGPVPGSKRDAVARVTP